MSNTLLGAINTAPTGGTTPLENSTYQSYTYTFTASQSQEELSLLFRNDPGFTWIDSISLVHDGDTANLLTNGDFESGNQAGSTAPVGWTIIGSPGLDNAGALGTAASSIDQTATPQAGTYFWVDGATNGYDGLGQSLSLVTGQSYTLSFQLAVDTNSDPGDTDGTNGGIDTQIWVGPTVQEAPPCFCRGTHILTRRGEIAVEALAVGDLVVTASGRGSVLKPVIWIGSTPFDARANQGGEDRGGADQRPVRIREGALGEHMPHRDLVVSPGHSLLIDGVLMQAERLVNGATIIRDAEVTAGRYFHIELAEHDILVSEGIASESYLDTGNRRAFAFALAGAERIVALHPQPAPRDWTETCVPLVQDGPLLEAARTRLVARVRDMGWRLIEAPTPELRISGGAVAASRGEATRWLFQIPPGEHAARLVSGFGVPAESAPASPDRRRLGLWVDGVAIHRGGTREEIPLDDPALGDGWHAPEQGAAGAWRWTDGDAGLSVSGPCELEISVGSCLPRWQAPAGLQKVAAAS